MAAIGSLVFCTDCGNLLDGSSGNVKILLECDVCGTKNRDTASTSITTKSKPTAFPSALRAKRSTVQDLTEADVSGKAISQEACPECGAKDMTFYTQQLRSADEGSTVFYECRECPHKHTVNN